MDDKHSKNDPGRTANDAETAEGSEPRNGPERDRPREIGGRGGLDPVRYGDWEKNGRCIDF